MAIRVDLQTTCIDSFSEETVRSRLTDTAIKTVREIAADTMERMDGYSKNIQLLNNGIFYGNEYYKALEKMSQIARLEFFKKKGSFYHGYASPQFFDMVKDPRHPTSVIESLFIIKSGVKPSAALKAISSGPSFIGCGETCQIGYLEAIKGVLGEEKFNTLFAPDSSTPLMIHMDNLDNPFFRLMKITPFRKKIEKGQIVFFNNVPEYYCKHINGETPGYFTICCDDTSGKETFTALGLRPEGITQPEIEEKFREEFNAEPVGCKMVTAEVGARILSLCGQRVEIAKQLEQVQYSKEYFAQRCEEEVGAVFEFNVGRIMELAKLSIFDARAVFDQWQKIR